ncbi:PqqD family protein [Paenibacillus tuaregi]|uniref:PqqD family protein n=1 Tax=Paenibacillus tuaregi TaxID=1816681 RepID=UPI000838FC58|nr:PqqD family protein [Paenibacillus tuaregi]
MCTESCSDVFYSKNIAWILLGDDVFVFDEITDKVYLLKDISKEFWLLIQEKKKLMDIIHQIAESYNVDFIVIKNDITKLARKFVENNLIVWSDAV